MFQENKLFPILLLKFHFFIIIIIIIIIVIINSMNRRDLRYPVE